MKKILALILAAACLFSACSKTEAQTGGQSSEKSETNKNQVSSETASKAPSGAKSSENEYYGKVTAINTNQITLAVGTWNMMQGGRQPSKEGGSSSIGSASAPSGEEEKDGSMPQDNAAPPEGEANKGGPGNRSDSSAPNGNTDGEPQEMINLTGEEKTIEISDESIITTRSGQESAAASLSQIEVGSILKVAVKSAEGGTETLVSVEIMSASPDDANKPDAPSV